MPAVVVRLNERNLEATFSKTPYLLVRVDRLPSVAFHRGIAEYLEHRFPRLFTFATISRTDFGPARLTELFHSAVGKLRSGVLDGYYLFEAGLVVGHHGGQTRPQSVSYGGEAEEEAQRQRIVNALMGERVSSADIEGVRQLAAYLEPIVERKQRASGFSDDGTSSAGGGGYHETSAPPPPRSTAMPPDNDPYVVLGITVAATDDEVRTAYHQQMKLNHPDKVAHLSPALQQFAQQQTLIVKHAYDAVLAMRGKGR